MSSPPALVLRTGEGFRLARDPESITLGEVRERVGANAAPDQDNLTLASLCEVPRARGGADGGAAFHRPHRCATLARRATPISAPRRRGRDWPPAWQACPTSSTSSWSGVPSASGGWQHGAVTAVETSLSEGAACRWLDGRLTSCDGLERPHLAGLLGLATRKLPSVPLPGLPGPADLSGPWAASGSTSWPMVRWLWRSSGVAGAGVAFARSGGRCSWTSPGPTAAGACGPGPSATPGHLRLLHTRQAWPGVVRPRAGASFSPGCRHAAPRAARPPARGRLPARWGPPRGVAVRVSASSRCRWTSGTTRPATDLPGVVRDRRRGPPGGGPLPGAGRGADRGAGHPTRSPRLSASSPATPVGPPLHALPRPRVSNLVARCPGALTEPPRSDAEVEVEAISSGTLEPRAGLRRAPGARRPHPAARPPGAGTRALHPAGPSARRRRRVSWPPPSRAEPAPSRDGVARRARWYPRAAMRRGCWSKGWRPDERRPRSAAPGRWRAPPWRSPEVAAAGRSWPATVAPSGCGGGPEDGRRASPRRAAWRAGWRRGEAPASLPRPGRAPEPAGWRPRPPWPRLVTGPDPLPPARLLGCSPCPPRTRARRAGRSAGRRRGTARGACPSFGMSRCWSCASRQAPP